MSLRRDKRRLRAEIRDRRARTQPEQRAHASRLACEAILASPQWADARTVGLFHSMAHEIATSALVEAAWRSGRTVALPVTPPLGLALGFRVHTPELPLVPTRFGALEPGPDAASISLDDIDLLVTPGLAFDARGGRLGHGGGYYDRTLPHARPAVMIAFAWQQVDQVPEEPHDARVDGVVTDLGWAVRPR